MPLDALLEELKQVDPETWAKYFQLVERTRYDFWPVWVADPITGEYSPEAETIFDGIIQGVLQRAIAGRGWTWGLSLCSDKTYIADVFEIAPGYSGDYWEEDHEYLIAEKESTSPAEALLAAYVAAARQP